MFGDWIGSWNVVILPELGEIGVLFKKSSKLLTLTNWGKHELISHSWHGTTDMANSRLYFYVSFLEHGVNKFHDHLLFITTHTLKLWKYSTTKRE